MTDDSCEGTHCPACGADPPERPFCNEVCKEPIFHTWDRFYQLLDRISEIESKLDALAEWREAEEKT